MVTIAQTKWKPDFSIIDKNTPLLIIMDRSRKDPHSPHGGNFRRREREGRKSCF